MPQAADRGWSAVRGSQPQIWYFHERQNAWFLTHMYYVYSAPECLRER